MMKYKNIFVLAKSHSRNPDPSSSDCSECISPGGDCSKCPNSCCFQQGSWKGCRLVGTGTSVAHKCDYPPAPSPPTLGK